MELNKGLIISRGQYLTEDHLVLVNQEDHRFQDGGDEEERDAKHEQQLNIPKGIILLWPLTNGITKQSMSLEYLVSLIDFCFRFYRV